MTERDFLEAIDDDPGADDTYLVYADWLEEQGQADRARLIRADLKDPHSREANSLRTRCKKSWPGYKQWERAFDVRWERGLPCAISPKEKSPSDRALSALPEFPWVTKLSVRQPPDADLVSLLRERTRLHGLCLENWGDNQIGDDGLGDLVRLAPWRGLDLCDAGLTDAGLALLAPLTQMRLLDVSANESITDAGVALLRDLRQLRELDLSYLDNVTAACLDVVLGFPELRNLGLAGIAGIDDSNVGRLSALAHLRDLDLARTGATRYRLLRVLKCPNLKRLHLEGAMAIERESGEMREVDAFREEAEAAGILVDMDWE
jgi:uncharacterized protein (TIGR02996 family)